MILNLVCYPVTSLDFTHTHDSKNIVRFPNCQHSKTEVWNEQLQRVQILESLHKITGVLLREGLGRSLQIPSGRKLLMPTRNLSGYPQTSPLVTIPVLVNVLMRWQCDDVCFHGKC